MEIRGKALSIKTLKTALTNSYGYDKNKEGFDGYEVVPHLTDIEAQVYYHPQTKHAIVSHRGTQGIGDVLQDVAFATKGYKGRRFKKAEKIQKEAERLYGAQNVSTVGHSLGSLLASHVGGDSKEIINYNKPLLPYGKKQQNEYNIKTSKDPFDIHWFTKNKSTNRIIPSKTTNPIYEHSIDRLDTLDPNEMVGGKVKVRDMKAMIRVHNKRVKCSDMKVKGYGKMKKAELQQALLKSFTSS